MCLKVRQCPILFANAARARHGAHESLRLPASIARHSPQECAPQFHVSDTNAIKPVTVNNWNPPCWDATHTSLRVEPVATDGSNRKVRRQQQNPVEHYLDTVPALIARRSKSAMTATYRALRKFGVQYHNRVNRKVQQISWLFSKGQQALSVLICRAVRERCIGALARGEVTFLLFARTWAEFRIRSAASRNHRPQIVKVFRTEWQI